mmetsp:Transcript_26131/g.77334  ORF Transcript_26131/g.77334 Transcript_26131/m.77334 type:complete len:866 (-) Transcript_26131:130-2727(-)
MSEDGEGSAEPESAGDDPSATGGAGGQSPADEGDGENNVDTGSGGVSAANDEAAGKNPPSAESELENLKSQLRDQDLQIKSLESNRQKQDESIALLRSELGAVQIKHKEECYWLRLEVDNLRKDKEALEDRMAELYRDMREIDNMNEGEDALNAPACVDSGYVLHLQSQLSKSMQTMGVLDNQIGMVKRSCDEVVKSLKEEIADVMDDKCRIEMELLNQLAVLDNEKRSLEDEYERETHLRDERIKGRDDVIQTLRDKGEDLEKQLADAREQVKTASGEESREARQRVKASVDRAMMSCSAFGDSTPTGTDANSSAMSSSFDDTGWKSRGEGDDSDVGGGHRGDATAAETVSKSVRDELAGRVEELERENALLEDKLEEEREAMHETSDQLRQNLEEQDERIERLTEELEVAQARGGAAADAEAILEAVHRDRDEALDTLESVAEVWEKADETIGNLEDIMEDMRYYDGDEDDEDSRRGQHKADRDKILSTLETATLVHSQIKVSLLLVELKLRNELTTLRNDGKLPTVLDGGVAGISLPTGPSGAGYVAAGSIDETTIAELTYHVDEVQRETLDSLEDVEKALMEQVEALERECEGESEDLRAELGDKIDALLDMKERNEELEADRADFEHRLDDLEGEKKELGRKIRELKGRAADANQGTEELRKELDRLEQENANLSKERKVLERAKKDLERANRDLEKVMKDQDRNIKEGERKMKDMDRGLQELEKDKKDLENSVGHYRKEVKEAKVAAKESAKKAADAAEQIANGSANQTLVAPSIDPVHLKMFEKLQKEIIAVVGKIKEKNDSISRLTAAAEEHKMREAALKKELKRIMKRVRAIEEGSDRNIGDRKSGSFRRRDQEER